MCVKSFFVIVSGLCDQLTLCSCLYKCKQVIKLLFLFFLFIFKFCCVFGCVAELGETAEASLMWLSL